MIGGLAAVSGAANRLGTVERIVLKVAVHPRCSVHGHHLKSRPAPIEHRKACSTPDLLNDLWQRGAEFFGVNNHIHTKFILS